jgi:hypothetical protein
VTPPDEQQHTGSAPPTDAAPALGAEPGLCAACTHAKVNQTRRGPAYLRCLRASWDERLARYPRLPVSACPGFEPSGSYSGTTGPP